MSCFLDDKMNNSIQIWVYVQLFFGIQFARSTRILEHIFWITLLSSVGLHSHAAIASASTTLPSLNSLQSCAVADQAAESLLDLEASETVRAYETKALGLCEAEHGRLAPQTLKWLTNVAITYKGLGRAAEALTLEKEVLLARTRQLGATHQTTLDLMSNLAVTNQELGFFDEAFRLNNEVYRITKQRFGDEGLPTLDALSTLALSYDDLGQYDEAREIGERLLPTLIRLTGPESDETLLIMTNLSATYISLSKPLNALVLAEKVFEIRKRKFGSDALETIAVLNNVAECHSQLGNFEKAYRLSEETYRLISNLLGPEHPESLSMMAAFATRLVELGRAEEALFHREKNLKLRISQLGENHPDTLMSMSNLAVSYHEVGRVAEALALDEKTVVLRRKRLGAMHPDTIASIHNLAQSLEAIGRPLQALRLRKEALALHRAKFGDEHPNTIASLADLASSLDAAGLDSEALSLREQEYATRKRLYGATHLATIKSWVNLANSYDELGRTEVAQEIRKNILDQLMTKLGPDHLETLRAMNNLAISFRKSGRNAEKMDLRQTVYEKRKKLLGFAHPDTLSALSNLALGFATQGDYGKTIPLGREFQEGLEALRRQPYIATVDQQDLFAVFASNYKRFALYFGIAANETNDPDRKAILLAESFNMADKTKSRTLVEKVSRQNSLQVSAISDTYTQKLRTLSKQLMSVDQSIRRLSQAVEYDLPGLQTLELRRRELNNEYLDLEKHLLDKYPKFSLLTNAVEKNAINYASLLNDDQVFISYLISVEGYLTAWTVEKGGAPQFFNLGQHESLDKVIEKLRNELSHMKNGRVFPGNATNEAALKEKLSDILLAPLEKQLRKKRDWIVAPDGILALLPFDALPLPKSWRAKGSTHVVTNHTVCIIQSFALYALMKARENDQRSTSYPMELLAMGNAIYDKKNFSTMAKAELGRQRGWRIPYTTGQRTFVIGASSIQTIPLHSEKGIVQSLRWRNLPGTAREVDSARNAFAAAEQREQVTTFVGHDASEATLQSLNNEGKLRRYRRLLFSAHGYLASDPNLSSLVLSQDSPSENEDGYITAGEWTTYDLNSELTILSACDTGVGTTLAGEGVMGLPYALFIAGNRNTLLTLWPVNDKATAEFMRLFFDRIAKGESDIAALAAVKRSFLNHKQWRHPRYWAAFILYGV